ncbi:ankyrin repeat and SAM domain-containing protein flippy isoform X2 [Rhodnius prolixus]|uniref:ankyrin repeat and SAM domain-containing protein flippy isoform X2 n=1 Tax=Rhodnius prolixus TaxID=13249 RepID=UPI003D189D8B
MANKNLSIDVLSSTQNTITLKWVLENEEFSEVPLISRVQIKDAIYKWITKYWGVTNQATIKELAPEHVYTIRVGMATESGEEVCSDSITAATKCGPLWTYHIFKAVETSKAKQLQNYISQRSRAIQAVNKYGETPLMQAARIGEINCMSVLLNAGSDPNCKMFPSLQTPLMAACFAGHKDVAELLVSHGASWTEKDICGRDALHYAISNSQLETAQMALNGGCGVNSRDIYNWTPLMRAGDVQLRDEHNHTCIDMAYLYKNENIILLITKRDEEEIIHEDNDRLISDLNEIKVVENT